MMHYWEITKEHKEIIQILEKRGFKPMSITLLINMVKEEKDINELKTFIVNNPKATIQEINHRAEKIINND